MDKHPGMSQKSQGGGGGPTGIGGHFHHMPPPSGLPPGTHQQRFMPHSPHNILPQSPHTHNSQVVQSPHHIVQSPHVVQSPAHVVPSSQHQHHINSPAHTHGGGGFGGGGGGSVFQFSDAHIGMAQADKENTLALSNPHQSPMSHSQRAASDVSQYHNPKQHQHQQQQQQVNLNTAANTRPGVVGGPNSGLQQYQQSTSSVHSGDAMLSAINYSDDMLHDSAFDVSGPSLNMDESILTSNTSGNNDSAFDLFDGDNNYSMENQQELPLSPSCSFALSEGSDSLSTLANVSTKQEPLGQNENSGSSHSSSISSQPEKPPGKVGRPGRGRGSTGGTRQIAQCQICGKQFNNSSALAKHKLTHSDERKHVCPICSKAFKRQDHLNGHMMTHRSKKPFECKFDGCDKSYCDARSLRRHLENHHQQQLNETGNVIAPHFFQFDQQNIYRQNSADSNKSPGCYQNQFSPISPAPGQTGWVGFVGVDEPKTTQCTICHRRFKNIPALNGHMRLHGGYFKPKENPNINEDDKQISTTVTTTGRKSTPPTITTAVSAGHQLTSSSTRSTPPLPPSSTAQIPVPIKVEPVRSSHSPPLSVTQGIVAPPHVSVQSSINMSRAHEQLMMSAAQSQALSQHVQMMSLSSGGIGGNGTGRHGSGGASQHSQRLPGYPLTSIHGDNHISQHNSAIVAGRMGQGQQHDNFGGASVMSTSGPPYPSHDITQMSSYPTPAQMGMSMLARRRSNVPAPLETVSMAEGLNALHSPSHSGSHPATPSHPLTPSHPHTPSHAMTPSQLPNNQLPSHPHTPANIIHNPHNPLTPNLPFTPSLLQQQTNNPMTPHTPHGLQQPQQANNPCTPHTPHTPSHPCTPSHPITPHNQQSSQRGQHFQFPPPQETVVEEQGYGGASDYSQQQSNFDRQMQEQQQQLQEMHLQEQARQMELQLRQELAQLQEEQTIQQIKEELQSHERQLQADLSQNQNNQSQASQQAQLEELMDTNISLNKSYIVHHVKMNLDLDRMEEFFRDQPQEKLEQFRKDRKRRASADPDKFTQPNSKKQFLSLMDDKMKSGDNCSIAEEMKNSLMKYETSDNGQKVDILSGKRDLNDNNTKNAADSNNSGFQRPKSPSYSSSLQYRHRLGEGSGGKALVRQANVEEDTEVNHQKHTSLVSSSAATSTDVFKNPGMTPSLITNTAGLPSTSTAGLKKGKRKHRPEPLIIPPHVNHLGFHSRLRSPRLWDPTGPHKGTTPPPYTPPPMLSPVRSGSGLFWKVHPYPPPLYRPFTPKSAPVFLKPQLGSSRSSCSSGTSESVSDESIEEEQPPETDIQPHVNIGPNYQAVLPDWNENRSAALLTPSPEAMLLDPRVMDELTDAEVQYYQDFACCAAVPGNGTNKEYALHLLYVCKGDVRQAMLKLMQGTYKCRRDDPLYDYKYQESDVWSGEEIEAYHQALQKVDKDFFQVAKLLGSKNVKQCIEFYYLWKKVCGEEYKRIRMQRRRRENQDLYSLRSTNNNNGQASGTGDTVVAVPSPKTSPKPTKENEPVTNKSFICQFSGCNATFHSRQALNGHIRIHSVKHMEKTAAAAAAKREVSPGPFSSSSRDTPSPARPSSNKSAMSDENDEFPCRVCGKIFYKVKSRNAHMKSHRVVEDKQHPPDHNT